LATLRGTSAMRCCDGFFMANSLSDPRDLLIPFFGKFETDRVEAQGGWGEGWRGRRLITGLLVRQKEPPLPVLRRR